MSLATVRRHVDTRRAEVVDVRSMGGEVISIPLYSLMQNKVALAAVADNLAGFMEAVTGRGYRKAEEVYDVGFTVREPGRQQYGLKMLVDQNAVIISRVSILEDETVFKRYVEYLRTGVLI